MEIVKKLVFILTCTISLMASDIVIKESKHSVSKTVENIKNIVTKKGFSVFNVIDHKANAASVGMNMKNAKVIIFGNPKVGTKLMKDNILSALDLPMKVLVYKDSDKKVKLAYRDGSWLKKTHSLNNNKLSSKIDGALNKITDKAIR